MKSVYAIAFAAVAAVASAQLDDLPACALTCLTGGLGETGCDITDFKCACSNEKFVSDSAACIRSGCDASEQQAALAGAVALCKSAGVDIPTTFPGSEPTEPATSEAPEPTAPAEPSAEPTSAEEEPTAAPSYGSGSMAPEPTTTASPTSPGNDTGNGTASSTLSPPVQTDNGAGKTTAAFSVMGLGFLAAFIL